jgi:GntR family transcriptional repressor for pyruvate dehydrogenase complex
MEMYDAEQLDPKSADILYDYRFHLAIARASKNPHIYQLLKVMAPVVMPRFKLAAIVDDASKDAYYRMIHREHERIVGAIEKRDDTAARKHMRFHIVAAIERLRKLAASLPEDHTRKAYESSPDLMLSLVRSIIDETH